MKNLDIDINKLTILIRIRIVEEKFLELFSIGKLNGTVHTCIGQELSALAFAGNLLDTDFVFSNHRCHGHFIAYTKNWKSLILELMGKNNGVCGGVGSSQHLKLNNFFSNGIQGGILPVAAGFGLGNKLHQNNNIGVVYIGDGTLGEGVVYETLNFISKKQVPILIVCENNKYAQSTPIENSLSGTIEDRAKAFGIRFKESNTFDNCILNDAKESIEYVRTTGKPLFHLVDTYRLKAHSKGDDNRDINEIKDFENRDFLNKYKLDNPDIYYSIYNKIQKEVNEFIEIALLEKEQHIDNYLKLDNYSQTDIKLENLQIDNKKQIDQIQNVFLELMNDKKTIFIGEDIEDPYGGAFKATKGLSDKYPTRVIGTSISELLIAGVANGLALNGFKPYAEFMFGDFIALSFDQFLNHASKFYNMYNKQITCPVVFRTPMGGKRGYGPTHSQTIEKHFVGMDMFEIIALNNYLPINIFYKYIHNRKHPTLVIENKSDYGKRTKINIPNGYGIYMTNENLPNLVIKPQNDLDITLNIIVYGGVSELLIENIENIFYELDELVQILVLSKIDPLPEYFILQNIQNYTKVITVEEGSERGSIGNNIISLIAQHKKNISFKCLTSKDITIPSAKNLEDSVLVNYEMIYETIKNLNKII